jgi:hypothetical protein
VVLVDRGRNGRHYLKNKTDIKKDWRSGPSGQVLAWPRVQSPVPPRKREEEETLDFCVCLCPSPVPACGKRPSKATVRGRPPASREDVLTGNRRPVTLTWDVQVCLQLGPDRKCHPWERIRLSLDRPGLSLWKEPTVPPTVSWVTVPSAEMSAMRGAETKAGYL